MPVKKRLAILLLAALCLLLAGCSFHNETLDAQMRAVVTALNAENETAFTKLLLMPEADESDLHALYTDLHGRWKPVDPDTAKLIGVNINIRSGEKTSEGNYIFENGQSLSFRYYEGDYGKGITAIGVSHSKEFETGVYYGSGWIVTLICAVAGLAFVVVTIVDIARKKPRNYGWYFVMAVVTFSLRVNAFRITLPLGAIIWWCIRRSVLQKKAALQETVPQQHTYTDTSRDPWEL